MISGGPKDKAALEGKLLASLEPFLARHGFRRRGFKFTRTGEEGNLNVVAFQSARSSVGEVRPSLGIVSMRLSTFLHPGRAPSAHDVHYGVYLLHLTDEAVNPRVHGDKAFLLVRDEAEVSMAEATIRELMETHGLPWFQQYGSDERIVGALAAGRGMPQTWSAVLRELIAGRTPDKADFEDL